MRPTDIVIQVQEGRCHLGVTGMDVFAEHAVETDLALVVVPDLGYGGCRLAVAVPESWIDVSHIMDLVDLTTEFKAAGPDVPRLDQVPGPGASVLSQVRHLLLPVDRFGRGPRAAPEPGHRRHHRRPDQLGDDLEGQPPARDRGRDGAGVGRLPDRPRAEPGDAGRPRERTGPLALLLDAIDGVRGAEGWLHLEVVGSQAAPGPETGRDGRRSSSRAGGLAHRPRRSLGRPRQPRLARDRPLAGRQADRLPARAVPPGRRPRRRRCRRGSSSTATAPRPSTTCAARLEGAAGAELATELGTRRLTIAPPALEEVHTMKSHPPQPYSRHSSSVARSSRITTPAITSCSRLEVRSGLPKFPGSIQFAVYAHLTELHGKYILELRLEDSQGDILWAVRADPPVKHDDPLMPHRFAFRDLSISVAAPADTTCCLMSEGIEIARHPLWVMEEDPPASNPPRSNQRPRRLRLAPPGPGGGSVSCVVQLLPEMEDFRRFAVREKRPNHDRCLSISVPCHPRDRGRDGPTRRERLHAPIHSNRMPGMDARPMRRETSTNPESSNPD